MDTFQLKYTEIGAFEMNLSETDIKHAEMDTFQLKYTEIGAFEMNRSETDIE